MLIEEHTSSFARGQWARVYGSGDVAASVVEVAPEKVVVTVGGYRVTLGKAEVDSIYRATYGIDWEKPE